MCIRDSVGARTIEREVVANVPARKSSLGCYFKARVAEIGSRGILVRSRTGVARWETNVRDVDSGVEVVEHNRRAVVIDGHRNQLDWRSAVLSGAARRILGDDRAVVVQNDLGDVDIVSQ